MKAYVLFALCLPLVALSQGKGRSYPVAETKAREIVDRALQQTPVIDGHNDLMRYYFDCKSCPRELNQYRLDTTTQGHTDIDQWKKGKVGCQLLNVFGNVNTARNLLDAYDLVYRMIEKYRQDLVLASSASDIRKAFQDKKIAILPTMEASIRLENSMAMVRVFHKLGLRAVTLSYQTNDIADGSEDSVKYNGLSSFGKAMVLEMNRTGIMADISHVSEKAMHDVLAISKAPVIFSHSNVRKLCDVNRNVSDAVLKELRENKGIIMLTFVPYFTTQEFADWFKKGDDYWVTIESKHKGQRDLMSKDMDQWEKDNPIPSVSIPDVADHFDYVKRLIGVDYIGIGSDFDGIDYLVRGLEDVSTFPALLTELARRGWSEMELRKIAGENFLRVLEAVETKAIEIQKNTAPSLAILEKK